MRKKDLEGKERVEWMIWVNSCDSCLLLIMLYGNEGFDGRSREPENWEDELDYRG